MSYILKLESRRESGTNLYHLRFAADGAVRESYHTPGQFLVIETPDGGDGRRKGFFAIASPPGEDHIELLIKRNGEPATTLCDAEPGAEFECSEAQGTGFAPVPRNADRVHLFSMGSGLAPLRAYILSSMRRKSGVPAADKLCLWQGSFTREHLPFREEYEKWESAGVEIVLCLDDQADFPGDSGNVVQRLKRNTPDLRDSAAFWIGSKEFGQALLVATGQLGLAPERLMTNF